MNRAERRRLGLPANPLAPAGRVVYGARCTWWDSIANAASKPSGLPCCPHCGSVLMEVPTESEWWAGVDRWEAGGHDGYREFVTWLRGRCYPSVAAAKAARAIAERAAPAHPESETPQ